MVEASCFDSGQIQSASHLVHTRCGSDAAEGCILEPEPTGAKRVFEKLTSVLKERSSATRVRFEFLVLSIRNSVGIEFDFDCLNNSMVTPFGSLRFNHPLITF